MTTQIQQADQPGPGENKHDEEKPQHQKKVSYRMEHINKSPPMVQTPPPLPEPEKIGEGLHL